MSKTEYMDMSRRLEYQVEVTILLENLVRRLERLIKIYEANLKALEDSLDVHQYNEGMYYIQLLGSMLSDLAKPANGNVPRFSRPRIRRVVNLGDDPPCLIDGKFQDKLICDECREKYPIISRILEEMSSE